MKTLKLLILLFILFISYQVYYFIVFPKHNWFDLNLYYAFALKLCYYILFFFIVDRCYYYTNQSEYDKNDLEFTIFIFFIIILLNIGEITSFITSFI